MGLSIKNIKKWIRMFKGTSLLHVNQNEGQCYSFEEIKGYYNNLTEKVSKDKEHYYDIDYYHYYQKDNSNKLFPVAIFQYGLGCYDLMLLGQDSDLMKAKFLKQVEWAVNNIEDSGLWNNFGDVYPHAPYGAMAQGEGASLLIRAYVLTTDNKYLMLAKKAIDAMLIDVNDGGTTLYDDEDVILLEYTHKPAVFNGWIFAIFGLMDYVIISKDDKYCAYLNKTIRSLERKLPQIYNGYWSKYDLGKTIASPFYHNLHIAQLKVLYEYTHSSIIKKYYDLLLNVASKKKNKRKAIFNKGIQKIFSKE